MGNGVGLDTPASVWHILHALQEGGYAVSDIPESGDALIHQLIDHCSYDLEFLTEDQLRGAAGRLDTRRYAGWFARLPEGLRSSVERCWGPPPGDLYV